MSAIKFDSVIVAGRHLEDPSNQPEKVNDALSKVFGYFADRKIKTFVDVNTSAYTAAASLPVALDDQVASEIDFCVVVGGDGTVLAASREYAKYKMPMVGINAGNLGFVTDIEIGGFEEKLNKIIDGDYTLDIRPLMQGRVLRDDKEIYSATAMNDVVVNRGSTSGMVELSVSIGNQFVSQQKADGLIIAAPTGSTAYVLSAGGPLVHPSIEAWIMTPIAPHNLSNRTIVLPSSNVVRITVTGGRDCSANFDMQGLAEVKVGDVIEVIRSKNDVTFLRPKDWSFYETLRNKLHWNY